MNKKYLFTIGGILAIILLAGYGRVGALAQPGDFNDPLVTKRYVDEQIAEVCALLGLSDDSTDTMGGFDPLPAASTDRDAIVAEVTAYFEAVYGDAIRRGLGDAATGQAPYETVFAQAGRTLIGLSGTEIILRGGSAEAVSGINGLCDVTAGNDVVNGADIKLNHLHIVPGSDGRGMRFTTDSYLMIKGDYYFAD